MIDLDKRILDGKKPLTAFDEIDSKFIGAECYFSDEAIDFVNVVLNCQKGRLSSVGEITGLFNATKNNSYAVFHYCLPVEWVKEEKKEPKYRPYTVKEFIDKFEFWVGMSIRLREKDTGLCRGTYEYKTVFTGYRWCDECVEVSLNGKWYTMHTLFGSFEYMENGEWQPFGVLDDGYEDKE